MDDVTRTQMLAHLRDLRALIGARPSEPSAVGDGALRTHLDQLEQLVRADKIDAASTRGAASSLESRLLALEAEHPQLAAFASRIARVLEDAGL